MAAASVPVTPLGDSAAPSSRASRSASGSGGGSSKQDCNVQVVCRFRPAREKDPFEWFQCVVEQVNIRTPERVLDFAFDRVFTAASTQADVYNSVRHVVLGVMEGFNGTLLTYGQTSSGKTHTMMGKGVGGQEGIIPRAVSELFQAVADSDEALAFTFKAQYVEIYCERVRDLLDPVPGQDLQIRQDPQEGVVVQGATEVYVGSQEEIQKVLELGQTLRTTSATRMNEESSRSHALFMLTVTQKNTETQHLRRGRLVLVDLAGSERISKTGAAGMRLEEAKNINRSLTTLGMVITALSEGKSHVPYRDAKLTRVLEESLGGNSKTCLIICCAPELSHSHETISTLRFGERAKRIKNRAVVNEELSAFELQQLLNKALAEIERLRALLRRYEQGGGPSPPSMTTPVAASVDAAAIVGGQQEEGGEGDSGDRSGSSSSSSSSNCIASAADDDEVIDLSRTGQQSPGEGGEGGGGGKPQDEMAWGAMEIELARLRSLLAAKDEENAQLSLANVELRMRLKEEAAAMATSMEEQRILEGRLREAEASMDQMMRALAAAKDNEPPKPAPAPFAALPQEEASVRADDSPPRPRHGEGDVQPFSPRSPSAQQIYEEKLQSVEKVCAFLQDELENQRETFEQVNRALLAQNAQLAMQKDAHVRQIFSLEVRVDELNTALASLRASLNGKNPYDTTPRSSGGLGSSLSSLFRSSAAAGATRGIVKTIAGGGGRSSSKTSPTGSELGNVIGSGHGGGGGSSSSSSS